MNDPGFGTLTVTKEFNFCYGHHLPGYEGKCREFHGHNAKLLVTFGNSTIEEYPGMVIDFGKIKEVVKPIIERLDHKDLNSLRKCDVCPELCPDDKQYFFDDEENTPTAENMVLMIRDLIRITQIGFALVAIRIYETPTSYAEWRA